MDVRQFTMLSLAATLVVGTAGMWGALYSPAAAQPPDGATGDQTGERAIIDSGEAGHSIGDDNQSAENGTIDYEFVGESERRVIVEGYRSGRLSRFFDVRLGESIRIPVRVTNRGATTASYTLPLTVGGETVDVKTGELDPGEETVVEPGFRFAAAQQSSADLPVYTTLELAGWETIVGVYGRDAMVLTDIEVSQPTAEVGTEVTVTATIANGDTPSVETVEVWSWGDVIHTETVSLDAGASTTVETTHTIQSVAGGHFSASGNLVTGAVASVTVDPESDIDEPDLEFNESDQRFNESDWGNGEFDLNVTSPEVNVTESDIDLNGSELTLTDPDQHWNTVSIQPQYTATEDGAGFGLAVTIAGILVATVFLIRQHNRLP